MPAGAPMNDYQGLVTEPDLQVDPRALVAALGVQRLDFTHMLAGQSAFAGHVRGEAASYRVEAPDGYAAYAEGRREAGSGVLKDIDKRRRKIEREEGPVTFAAHSRSASAFDQLIDWKRGQYRAGHQTDIFDALWPLAAAARSVRRPRPGIRRGAVHPAHGRQAGGGAVQPARPRQTIHAWIIAHDDAFERYSPGLVLFGEILRWMEGGPFTTLDLGSGDYRFKQQLSNAQRPVGHGFVGRPSPASLIRSAQYGVRAAAEALPLGSVSALPGKAMRRMDLLRGLR